MALLCGKRLLSIVSAGGFRVIVVSQHALHNAHEDRPTPRHKTARFPFGNQSAEDRLDMPWRLDFANVPVTSNRMHAHRRASSQNQFSPHVLHLPSRMQSSASFDIRCSPPCPSHSPRVPTKLPQRFDNSAWIVGHECMYSLCHC